MKITVDDIESSMIKSFSFERKTLKDTSGVLNIDFRNGFSYAYEDVSMFDFQYLIMTADSIGVAFIDNIRNKYTNYRRTK